MKLNHGYCRVDENGRAHAGSQRQLQNYVNDYRTKLNAAVVQAMPSECPPSIEIVWASPLASQKYAEYRDRAFLEVIGLGHHRALLRKFWPSGGPRWDALAHAKSTIIFLSEAKSHISEMYGNGCGAKSENSLSKIQNSLRQTQAWLDIHDSANWTGRLYQYANRLAHLYFLRRVLGVEAWLLNVYFVNDPHSPTTLEEWRTAIPLAKSELGLPQSGVPYSVDIFLDAIAPTSIGNA